MNVSATRMTHHNDSNGDNWTAINRRTALRGLAGGTLGAVGLSGTAGADSDDCAFVIDGIYIQDAIDDAEPGATLCLDSVEQKAPSGGVLIDKELTIVPLEEDEPFTLDATGRKRGVRIEADNVTVKGMRILGGDETTTGISIFTGPDSEDERATANITLANNSLEGMQKPGGPNNRFSWGILSFGQNPLHNVKIRENEIAGIGSGDTTAGIGIGLEELEGEEPGEGAKIEENHLKDIAGSDDPPIPGTGIAINPLDGESSNAGPPGAKVEKNRIEETALDVIVGDLRATAVIDGIL